MESKMKRPEKTREIIDHLDHVSYPVTGKAFMAACDNMSDQTSEQRTWVRTHVSEDMTYNSKEELRKVLEV